MHRENNKIIASACLAHRAGLRLSEALRSWERELQLEIDHDLSELVNPLKAAFVDTKTLLMAAVKLMPPAPWSDLTARLVQIAKLVADGVTEPWKHASKKNVQADIENLAKAWKTADPLAPARHELDRWSKDLLNAWLEAAPHVAFACLPAPPPRDKIKFFVASSFEGEDVARSFSEEIKKQKSNWNPLFWAEAFPPGESALETLQKEIGDCHFGVYVMTADDKLVIRDESTITARGNVIFEYGIGVGCHGRKLSFVVHDSIYTITDLKGITTIPYAITATTASLGSPSVKKPMWKRILERIGFLKASGRAAKVKHPAPDPVEVTRIASKIIQSVESQIDQLERDWAGR